MFHCIFSYFETERKSQPRVNTTKSWNYPNLEIIMKDLNNRWIKEKVPLKITEKSGKVLISHTNTFFMGSLAQLKLSSNLAYLLGYTSEVEKEGQYLRFDEHSKFLAPHEPKLFMNYCSESEIELEKLEVAKLKKENQALMNDSMKQEAKHQVEMNRVEEKWKSYAKTKIASNKDKLTLECLKKLRIQREDLEEKHSECINGKIKQMKKKLEDFSDRLEKGIQPIKNFDKFYDQSWIIKGVVTNGNMAIEGNYKEFNMTLEDYSGAITITAFGRHAELLSGLCINGMQYYLSNTNDQSNMTASINNNVYKVVFNAVN